MYPNEKRKIAIVRQGDTFDGVVRWDVIIDGEWDSSWDKRSDARDRKKYLEEWARTKPAS